MKAPVLAVVLASGLSNARAEETNPIAKVLQLITELQAKIIGEGEEAQKMYAEFAEFCEDRSRELGFEIKTGKGQMADLTATIDKMNADIEAHSTKIEELGGDNAEATKELKEATGIREKEAADFSAVEKDLVETTDMLERAIAILEKEGSGASLMQTKSAQSLTQAFEAMVQATALSTADGAKLTALVQSSAKSTSDSDDDDDDDETAAPEAAAYESKSGSIVTTLDDLLDKAQSQLADARKEETEARHNYEMKKQSLEDSMKFSAKDMDDAKSGLAACEEQKATAEGDLSATTKDSGSDVTSLEELHHDCMAKAQDFEEEVSSRAEELKALAAAKKIVQESSGGASDQSYGDDDSFLQVKMTMETSAQGSQALKLVRHLAHDQHSKSLAQLAKRMSSAMRLASSSGADPFAKVKSMVADMLAKLQAEADSEADHKAFCDKEMKETTAKKEDKEAELEKLSTKIEKYTAESNKLGQEVSVLQSELAEMTKNQAEMDKLRAEEKGVYDKNKPELEQGLDGVKMALKVLREYYAKDDASHAKADGGASGIIGLLEVAESDFSKNLAEMVAAEESAAGEYEGETKQNSITKASKEQDVKFKGKEIASLEKAVSELSEDKDGATQEYDAVMQYLKGIKNQCVAKAEPYEERKARREAEINGLKEALDILEGETALIQRSSVKRTLRGGVLQPLA